MKLSLSMVLVFCCNAQITPKDIPPSRLQAIIDLPLNEAIQQRAVYKVPLKSAYERQMAMSDKGLRD